MTVLSHLVYGKVYDIYGNILANSTVELTHSSISPVISGTSNSSGEYILNLANLDSQWSVGDSFLVKGYKTAEGTRTVSATIDSNPGQIVNITLDETSLSDFYIDGQLRYPLNFSIPLHYDGYKITRLRPFPVITENPIEKYVLTDQDVSGNPQFYGFIDRFGNWYIRQDNTTDGTYRYIRGSSNYQSNWSNRATLTFQYFNDVF